MSVLLSGSLAFLLYAHGPLPTVDGLVKKLHAPRKGITSFEIVIDAHKGEGKARPHIRHIWRDGARYRVDHMQDFSEKGSARFVDCTNGPELGLFFFVRYDPVFDRSKAATMMPLSARRETGVVHGFQFEDLGATPESLGTQAHARGIDWYLGREEETADLMKGAETWVERCRWKGQLAFKIMLSGPKLPRKPSYEVIMLPGCDFAAVASRASWESNGRKSAANSESELARVSGIWLPKSSVYCKSINGTQVTRLNQTIEYIRLNKAPDLKVFTLEGMGLIRWTLVGTKDGTMTWDGTKLVPYEPIRK